MRRTACVVAALCICLPHLAGAQVPQGHEFRVNSYSPEAQTLPAVTTDGRGDALVAWMSHGQDGSGWGVFVRRVGPSGRAPGPEFQVNSYTLDDQVGPHVASRAGRDAVVAWQSGGQDGSGSGVFGRRLDLEGRPLGSEFRVTVATLGSQRISAIAMDAAGGFLVVWTDDLLRSYTNRFDTQGVRVGAELRVADSPIDSAVALAGGGFVVVGGGGGGADPQRARGRRLDDLGAPVGSEFLLGTFTSSVDARVSVDAVGPDGFVAAWASRVDSDLTEVRARLFDSAFAPRGVDFRVHQVAYQHQTYPAVAGRDDGGFSVAWINQAGNWHAMARRFDAGGVGHGAEFQVDVDNPYFMGSVGVAVARGGQMMVVWTPGLDLDVFGRQFGFIPGSLSVDASPDLSNGNRVLEAGETVRVAPSWANHDRADYAPFGTAFSFTGPGSAGAYSVRDVAASYGLIADGGTGSCEATGDCYRVALAAVARPSMHWDATLEETLSNRFSVRWPVHVGGSFADVAVSSPYYPFVETLLHRGVSNGCTGSTYCPSAATAREQMAVFVLTAAEGEGYQPPSCTTPVFGDVPAASPSCPFVEELARRQVVAGCGGGRYCPQTPVTRAETAVFVLRTVDPALSPPACGTPVFADVPAASPFCRWIEELARRGIAAGCGGGNYCPDAPVTREQMAVFVGVGFGLALYAP